MSSCDAAGIVPSCVCNMVLLMPSVLSSQLQSRLVAWRQGHLKSDQIAALETELLGSVVVGGVPHI